MKGFARGCKLAGVCAVATMSLLAHGAEAGASADELIADAQHVLAQIDAGQFAAVWQEAAPFVKAKYPEGGFESGLSQLRQSVGTVSRRGWASVTRLTYSHNKVVPDGLYANVDYTTWRSDGRVVYEKVSFQLGNDGRWYFTGYEPRASQNVAPQAQVSPQ
jgi:urease gamma subunit